jgi:hypothetical protein
MLIFGIGKGFLINLLLTSQKLLRKHTALFFFGILNKGLAHSNAGCRSYTPSLTSLSTSLIRVSVSLVLGKLGRDMETHPLLVERNWLCVLVTQSAIKERLIFPEKLQLLLLLVSTKRLAIVSDNLTGDLLYYIWHLESALHVR